LGRSDASASGSGHGALADAAEIRIRITIKIMSRTGPKRIELGLERFDLFFDFEGATELVGGDFE
jgi:hypothetical protein